MEIIINQYIARFSEIDQSSLTRAGGKGANLGELFRIPEIIVPEGFCITTRAYEDFVSVNSDFEQLLNDLNSSEMDHPNIRAAGERIRTHLESLPIPEQISKEIVQAWQQSGTQYAYAVRSSATAEDLPGASFAGQQDTFLNILNEAQLLNAVRNCWASLFTDRAIAYRQQNQFAHNKVRLAVVVQRMVFPEVSGIMFTADPVGGNRNITSIDASFGLGEALVSGLVSADLFKVRDGHLLSKQIAKKDLAIIAGNEGGTKKVELDAEKQTSESLSDEEAATLASLGRVIEKHFGVPQDIEWCIAAGVICILQSRPITTLYPIPQVSDQKIHLFISFGHPQMMTEAMKPLGISVLRTMAPFAKTTPRQESGLLLEAGSRLYIDISPLLHYPQVRNRLPGILPALDESISRSMEEFIHREEFHPAMHPEMKVSWSLIRKVRPTVWAIAATIFFRNNRGTSDEINRFIDEKVKENQEKLDSTTGSERIMLIQDIISAGLTSIIAKVARIIPPAIGTYVLIERLARRWLGDASELQSISKSPPGNVTTEMGLALGDLADETRKYPEVIAYLKRANDTAFFEELEVVPGGQEVLPQFTAFFKKYGMRGTGEIDLTRPRWYETPTQMVPILLSHLHGSSPGQHRISFQSGKEEAEKAAVNLVTRVRTKPWGFFKALLMHRLIKVHRSLIGLREHPKFYIIQNFDLIKRSVLQEADKLVEAGLLNHREDVFWFSLAELAEIIDSQQVDHQVMTVRIEKFWTEARLTPPRVMTSEGEIILGRTNIHVPPGALAGSPVSAGIVEGRARVVLHLEEAEIDRGDILVTPYTDPSWTPLFTLAAGLVTEVGGLMTHGAVVAREYGIPAVVGVDEATRKIKDGQQIRINGTEGYVQVLS
ncbi:MAG TPA: phosphoenolpyruvate synthase [Syntrophomonadaceae bacterium]|nr:phosphoenolpyruvate synthase [Syntrophomonadaceae bacterium]